MCSHCKKHYINWSYVIVYNGVDAVMSMFVRAVTGTFNLIHYNYLSVVQELCHRRLVCQTFNLRIYFYQTPLTI